MACNEPVPDANLDNELQGSSADNYFPYPLDDFRTGSEFQPKHV